VVITKEEVSLAFVNQNEEIDRIPLDQVDFVREFIDTSDEASKALEPEEDNLESSWHIMQIATDVHGYNGGRSYYLRSNSKYTMDNLIVLLQKLVFEAKESADSRNLFWRAQHEGLKIYHSTAVQSVIALLIAGVGVNLGHSQRSACTTTY
jgi:hypothetical protein